MKKVVLLILSIVLCLAMLAGCAGSQGEKGDTGIQGPQGEQGIQGPKGDNGTNGGFYTLKENYACNEEAVIYYGSKKMYGLSVYEIASFTSTSFDINFKVIMYDLIEFSLDTLRLTIFLERDNDIIRASYPSSTTIYKHGETNTFGHWYSSTGINAFSTGTYNLIICAPGTTATLAKFTNIPTTVGII